jgi:ATP:corrinoid adenosyltransferase
VVEVVLLEEMDKHQVDLEDQVEVVPLIMDLLNQEVQELLIKVMLVDQLHLVVEYYPLQVEVVLELLEQTQAQEHIQVLLLDQDIQVVLV